MERTKSFKEKAQAVNPFNGQVLYEYDYLKDDQIKQVIQDSWDSFLKYRQTEYRERSIKLHNLADYLEKNKDKIAKTIVEEMGKAVKESRAEVEKAAKHARYYADHLAEYLEPEVAKTDAKKSYVVFQPLGPIFHITPFNFPFWLIFKGVIPCIAMGNTVVNKNPASCPRCGILAEEAFKEAGFVNKEFQNVIVHQKQSEVIISNPLIRGVSFTGSTAGGAKIASLAGKYCKKAVMELGGSDPFVVFEDADVEYAVDQGLQSRLRNSGQVCTAAKRFIVEESVYDTFRDLLVERVSKMKVGDPMEESTQIGPLAKRAYVDDIAGQVKRAIEHGAKLALGGKEPEDANLKNGYYYVPTIVEVEEGNPILKEETFGPVFTLIKFKGDDEAVKIANDTEYGLAGAVFSRNEERAEQVASQIETGVVYINNMVSSGSDLPGGGVKNSGFGREGGKYGAHEFVNVKTVWVGKGNPKAK